jgi:FdhD protein
MTATGVAHRVSGRRTASTGNRAELHRSVSAMYPEATKARRPMPFLTAKPELELEVPKGATAVSHTVVSFEDRVQTERTDQLAVEEPLEIRLAGKSLAVTMRTPGHDQELVAGFLLSERLIEGAGDVDVIAHYGGGDEDPRTGNVINVLLKRPGPVLQERLQRSFFTSSACGVCGKSSLEAADVDVPPVAGDVTVPLDVLYALAPALAAAQATFERTGGLHAAALFDMTGQRLGVREDVGRHNAVDKLIGHVVLTGGLPLDRHILLVSGRASYEIIQKALVARIPVVAAISAPSSLAVQLALANRMTLVGFLRPGRLNVYANAHRIRTAPA